MLPLQPLHHRLHDLLRLWEGRAAHMHVQLPCLVLQRCQLRVQQGSGHEVGTSCRPLLQPLLQKLPGRVQQHLWWVVMARVVVTVAAGVSVPACEAAEAPGTAGRAQPPAAVLTNATGASSAPLTAGSSASLLLLLLLLAPLLLLRLPVRSRWRYAGLRAEQASTAGWQAARCV